jgi:hypothetical protein
MVTRQRQFLRRSCNNVNNNCIMMMHTSPRLPGDMSERVQLYLKSLLHHSWPHLLDDPEKVILTLIGL